MKVYINDFGGICSAGETSSEILKTICENKTCVEKIHCLNKDFMVGKIKTLKYPLKEGLPRHFQSRTNLILYQVLLQIQDSIRCAIKEYGADRIGVVIGTTTTAVEENFKEIHHIDLETFTKRNTLSNPSAFVAHIFGLQSLQFGISSACTSGGKALVSARRLLEKGLCDAVICGGVDSLNTLTIFGFDSLDILSQKRSVPFSKNREGVNLGEGAAVFLMTKKKSLIEFKGFGGNNDAFHITKPNSSCEAQSVMIQQAMQMANVKSIDYVNLHGTGTLANDSMESELIHTMLKDVPCSSTKGVMGHTLGAAGALEAMVCLELLRQSQQDNVTLPLHCFDSAVDANLPIINLITNIQKTRVKNTLSLSFAFGGDNCALIFGVS